MNIYLNPVHLVYMLQVLKNVDSYNFELALKNH